MERISSYFIVNLLWGSGSYSIAIWINFSCLYWNWWIYCLFNGIINYLLSYRSTGWKFYYFFTNKKEILILLNSIELLKNIKHFPTYKSHNTYRSVKVSRYMAKWKTKLWNKKEKTAFLWEINSRKNWTFNYLLLYHKCSSLKK